MSTMTTPTEIEAAVISTTETYVTNADRARAMRARGMTVKSIAAILHMPYVRTRWILKGLDGIKPRCASCGTMTTRISDGAGTAMCASCDEGTLNIATDAVAA